MPTLSWFDFARTKTTTTKAAWSRNKILDKRNTKQAKYWWLNSWNKSEHCKCTKLEWAVIGQNAPPLSRAEKPGQSQPVSHRRLCVQATLPGDSDGLVGLYLHRHHETIHRLTHHVRSYQGDPKGCPQHILLDPSHLHIVLSSLEAGWHWRPASGSWQNPGRQGQKACQILPVGRLLPIFSGKQPKITLKCQNNSLESGNYGSNFLAGSENNTNKKVRHVLEWPWSRL